MWLPLSPVLFVVVDDLGLRTFSNELELPESFSALPALAALGVEA